jgi:hypothetical protein
VNDERRLAAAAHREVADHHDRDTCAAAAREAQGKSEAAQRDEEPEREACRPQQPGQQPRAPVPDFFEAPRG